VFARRVGICIARVAWL